MKLINRNELENRLEYLFEKLGIDADDAEEIYAEIEDLPYLSSSSFVEQKVKSKEFVNKELNIISKNIDKNLSVVNDKNVCKNSKKNITIEFFCLYLRPLKRE